MANEEYPFTTFRFHIQISVPNATALGIANPLCKMAFAEMEGLEVSIEPKTVHEGGNNTSQLNLVGKRTYGNLTLKRGMTANMDMWKWFFAAAGSADAASRAETSGGNAAVPRANGVVLVKDASGKDRMRIQLRGCMPTRMKGPALNAREGGIAIEELQIAVNSFSVEAV